MISVSDDNHFSHIVISAGAYEIESLNDEIKRIIIDENHFSEENYPFKIKPNFTTHGSIVETIDPEAAISFNIDDSIGSLLGFNKRIIYEE